MFGVPQPIHVYFEMYNLERDAGGSTRYEIEAILVKPPKKGLERLIRRAFKGRVQDGVSVRFENEGATEEESQRLILDTLDQEAGTYLLVVRVRDQVRGRTVESRRTILLE